jgi:hypothetical protein
MPRHAGDTDTRTVSPDELDGDMTVNEIVYTLQHLPFTRSNVVLISLDRSVRDYLVRSLQQR